MSDALAKERGRIVLDSRFIPPIGRLRNVDRWQLDSSFYVRNVSGSARRSKVVKNVTIQRLFIRNHTGLLRNCSRATVPHSFLRASAMSLFDMEMPGCFYRPRNLFSAQILFVPRKLAESRTSSCCSGCNGRNAATRASSIEVGVIGLLFPAQRPGCIS